MAPRKPAPVTYLLRDVDAALWAAFKARADADGIAMRTALVELVAAYAAGDLQIASQTTTTVTSTTRARRAAR